MVVPVVRPSRSPKDGPQDGEDCPSLVALPLGKLAKVETTARDELSPLVPPRFSCCLNE